MFFLCAVAAFAGVSPLFAGDWPAKPYATNDQPATQIRFNTPAGADAKRQQLINYIWPTGLPTSTQPTVTKSIAYPATDLTGLNQSLIASVDKLDANISGLDFHAISYVLHPKNTANERRAVIVHQGHVYTPDTSMAGGVGDAVNRLLRDGYSVIAVNMPLCGWNSDRTVVVPGGSTVTIPGTGSSGHCDLFNMLSPSIGNGGVFRLFLEPVVQDINYLKSAMPGLKDVSMIGLSGGGWTTAMAPAIDARIKLSIPIAGSAPLYVQNRVSAADAEQVDTPMYDERINADGSGGGVATYLECYTLGAYGDGRRQIMVTIPGEPVGLYPTTWLTDTTIQAKNYGKDLVGVPSANDLITGVMGKLHNGQWTYAYDVSAPTHQISPWTIDHVIMPALQTPEPSSCVSGAIGAIGFGLYVWAKRPTR